MAEQGDAFFESRRIEQLSNTIFGVAMTLLAYGFPKEQFTSGAPDWRSIARDIADLVARCSDRSRFAGARGFGRFCPRSACR